MTKVALSKTKIETKLAIIRESLEMLYKMSEIPQSEFVKKPENYASAEHYLRRSLEAIFDIGGHILSRYSYSPGSRPSTFKGIAGELGEKKIVSAEFAKNTLVKMAGYRNRMVHFYDEITEDELYEIISKNLKDIEIFAEAVKKVLNNPKKYGLTLGD